MKAISLLAGAAIGTLLLNHIGVISADIAISLYVGNACGIISYRLIPE